MAKEKKKRKLQRSNGSYFINIPMDYIKDLNAEGKKTGFLSKKKDKIEIELR